MEPLNYLEIIDYSIKRIDKINSISDILNHWKNKINDITEERHNQLLEFDTATFISTVNVFIGQKNYFFNFSENNNLFGEFSIDFLHLDGNKYLKSEFTRMAIKTNKEKDTINQTEQRVVNWRIQLFSPPNVSENIINQKYSQTLQWINAILGKNPNSIASEVECAKNIGNQCNQEINCWTYNSSEKEYLVTVYRLKERPSISFSIMEGLEKPAIY